VTGLLVIGAVCAWWYHGNESLQGNAHRPSAIANYIAAPVTIAVLPFANLSSNPAQESFSDGLTEEILNELAQITSLSVIGRTSSFSFKGKNVDLRVIGQQLGVANLLEGSVRREGDTLRISAKLISSDSGTQLWSRSYEREMRGVFALQQEVAQDVARALQVRLDVGEMSRARGGTTNVDAYEKYLRSTQLYRHDGSKDIAESAGLLREALALDPDFLLAWIVRAAVATTELGWGIGDPQTTLRELSEAQRRILTLAPASPAAAGIRVTELAAQRKWGEALKAIGDGTANRLELTSISSAISQSDPVQMLLRSVGRANEAYALSRKLSRLDPLNLMLSANLQWDLGVTSQTEAVQTEYERSSALVGDHGRVDHFVVPSVSSTFI
jgi:TolB-like protein